LRDEPGISRLRRIRPLSGRPDLGGELRRIFSTGQNFYLYLDPRSNKFGFVPWDLDHSWGNFPFIVTAEARERVSIWHPWVGDHRFLERVMAVEEFRKIYRERMEELFTTKFTPERLNRRIDEIPPPFAPPSPPNPPFGWTASKKL
jgi:hypothetical protein